ncbi:hypothetical protein GCM10009133_11790 [Cocleimonas flava]|uniref:Uncharacterized protein n=1 Tax=Cocleimonas flava TaxID=634765 RepID=A0A4R1F4N6_9GAMM|nr:hypothetical protein [Cocleimonas flava]TCJ87544.1 hypothetical protein EV695_2055 [Cocleimonas flava]
MSLDFHIGNNRKEATYQRADASFDLQSHILLFEHFGLPEGKFTLFKRLEDYYKDTKFSAEELETLIGETHQIKTLISKNTELTQQLKQLLVVFEKAFNEQKSIWVFCD